MHKRLSRLRADISGNIHSRVGSTANADPVEKLLNQSPATLSFGFGYKLCPEPSISEVPDYHMAPGFSCVESHILVTIGNCRKSQILKVA